MSTSTEIVEHVRSLIENKDRVTVFWILITAKNTFSKELRIYNKLVRKGSYLIVEGISINGHPVYPGFGPGPWKLLRSF